MLYKYFSMFIFHSWFTEFDHVHAVLCTWLSYHYMVNLIANALFATHICGKVMFSYCLSVSVSVQAITLECLDREPSFLVWWYIWIISRVGLSIKVIQSRSLWLLRAKILSYHAEIGFICTKMFGYGSKLSR